MKNSVLFLSAAAVLTLCVAAEARPRHRGHFGGFQNQRMAPNGGGGGDGAEVPPMTRSEERQRIRKGFLLAAVADTDGDHGVTADEWTAFLDSLETDENGVIDMDALVALLPEPPSGHEIDIDKLSEKLDVDADGVVEIEDLEALFDALDANDDGELMSFETRKRKRFGKRARRKGGKVVRLADADASGDVTADEWDDFLASLDGDEDGVISAGDVLALLTPPPNGFPDDAADKLTRRLDRDKDGVLEVEDLEEIFLQLDADEDGALSEDELPGKPPASDDDTAADDSTESTET